MNTEHPAYPFVDLALARRLERTEASGNAESVAARARVRPDSGAGWISVAGAYAMFDGVDSPLTQTFGLGLFEEITGAEFEEIEAFFAERAAPVFHEVSPLAQPNIVALLNERGYHPLEFTSVMYRPVTAAQGLEVRSDARPDARVQVRLATDGEQDVWARTAAAGWSEFPEVSAFMRDIGVITAARADASCFLALLDGEPIATGVLSLRQGVALLAGASTVPAGRRQGAQRALLDARLRFAAARGCDTAMMCAAPGSASQRNAERHGFRIAYTRLKWRRESS